jgi:hypothetical protein
MKTPNVFFLEQVKPMEEKMTKTHQDNSEKEQDRVGLAVCPVISLTRHRIALF